MKDGVNSREDGMLMLDSAYNLARFLSRDAVPPSTSFMRHSFRPTVLPSPSETAAPNS